MILLDTNILIDYLRKKQKVVEYINNLEKQSVAITSIVAMELYKLANDIIWLRFTAIKWYFFQFQPPMPSNLAISQV